MNNLLLPILGLFLLTRVAKGQTSTDTSTPTGPTEPTGPNQTTVRQHGFQRFLDRKFPNSRRRRRIY